MSLASPTDAVLVTGGAGFIGSALIRRLIATTDYTVVNLDKLTYAGNLASLVEVEQNARYRFVHIDIAERGAVDQVFTRFSPLAVVHLAAETHVDRSIDDPSPFINTNLVGTFSLLESTRFYLRQLDARRREAFRFIHVSTDEVFGQLGLQGAFTEETPYRPNSPYAATKAGSDHLARAWHHTYGLPVIVTNTCNNYGPCQFPEKLIPLMIMHAEEGKRLPVYGRGENVRDWLYVDDHAAALIKVLESGVVGETYAIGGRQERSNLEVVRSICALVDEMAPRPGQPPRETLIEFVEDRPGHDLRYAIDPSRIERELGWGAEETFESGLRKTVAWYLGHRSWRDHVLSGAYRGERQGLLHSP